MLSSCMDGMRNPTSIARTILISSTPITEHFAESLLCTHYVLASASLPLTDVRRGRQLDLLVSKFSRRHVQCF